MKEQTQALQKAMERLKERTEQTNRDIKEEYSKYKFNSKMDKTLELYKYILSRVSPSNVFDTNVKSRDQSPGSSWSNNMGIAFTPEGIGERTINSTGSHVSKYREEEIHKDLLLRDDRVQAITTSLIDANRIKGLKHWNAVVQTLPTFKQIDALVAENKKLTDGFTLDANTEVELIYTGDNENRFSLVINRLVKSRGEMTKEELIWIKHDYQNNQKQKYTLTLRAIDVSKYLGICELLLDETKLELFDKNMKELAIKNARTLSPDEATHLNQLFLQIEQQLAPYMVARSI
jgi:hypothetical protein